jgi:tripartite-type tricarboxylate transporter receptor subunit TctC
MRQAILAAGIALAVFATSAAAQYPVRPIRMIVPSAAGGTLDIVTRTLSRQLAEQLGQPVVVENRAAATTMIGEEAVARAANDGYTLLMTGLTLATTPLLRKDMPFDPQRDLDPISMVATAGNILAVHPSVPARTVQEFIEFAKKRPEPLFYGTPSHGSTAHFAAELFNQMAGTKLVQVPYKGSGLAMQDLVAGQIQVSFDNIPVVIGHVRSGKARAIAVTSAKRSPQLPDVPTIAESGLSGYAISAWFGLLAPARTPPEVITRLNAETQKALASAEVKERFASIGFEPAPSTAAAFRKHIADEAVRMGRVVRESGMKTE